MKKIDGWVTAPQGFLAAGVKAGIKASGNHDVAVIYSTVPAATGAVFTQNKNVCGSCFSKQRSCTRGCGSGYYSQQRLCECLYR